MRPGSYLVVLLWLPSHLVGTVPWAPILLAEWIGPGFDVLLPNWRYVFSSLLGMYSWFVNLFVVMYLWEYFRPDKEAN